MEPSDRNILTHLQEKQQPTVDEEKLAAYLKVAIAEAKENKTSDAKSILKRFGKEILLASKDIGVDILTSYIKKSTGL